MSWDVVIQHLPASAVRLDDVPDDFVPLPLGSRADVLAAMARVFPSMNAADPTSITIEAPGYSIECGIADDPVNAFTLHVRGDESVVPAIARLIELLGARGIDTWAGEFFDTASAAESIRRWSLYVDEL